MPTISSLPEAMACRAVATSGIFAAWKVGNPVAARISPAKSRCGAVALSLIAGVFALADFLQSLLTKFVGVRPALPLPAWPCS